MEPQTPTRDYHSSVDTSRPFRSVKEAVAIFGERILIGEIYSPKPYTFTTPKRENILSSKFSSSPESCQLNQNYRHEDHRQNHGPDVVDTLKKLEAELENTKAELKALKERESETEILLASLNAELHKNMSKLAEVEAAAAKKAAASFETHREEVIMREEEMRKELKKRMEKNQTLAHILGIGEDEGIFGGRRERKMKKKKKSIVPLIGDFFRRKGSPTAFHSSLYESPDNVYFN